MKNSILNIGLFTVIFMLMLPEVGCYRRRFITETKRPAPVDDIYAQADLYNQRDDNPVSYQVFYDELSPYGNWIDYPEYGYVWVPRVSVDFHPYATNGYWVMTNYGWTWVSDFRWGWAAFHYGRWAYEPLYGWMWIPGRVWGPAWVAWRESDDYFGWAPLGPFVDISINMVINCPFDHYRFVPRGYFTHRNIHDYCVDWHKNSSFFDRTRFINETHEVNKNRYFYGPRKDFVEKSVGQKINAVNVHDNPKPDADVLEKDRVRVYRPRMDNVPKGAPKPSPKRVDSPTDLKPIPEDKRLTPNVKRELQKKSEGVEPRPDIKQPQRESPTQPKPDANKTPIPKYEPRPEIKQPRTEKAPQPKPNVTKQPTPKYEPRRDVKQPQPEKAPKTNPPKTQQRKEKTTAPTTTKAIKPTKDKN